MSVITSLTEAVVEADTKIKKSGGMVNPGTHTSFGRQEADFVHTRTALNFDIAVSATESTTGGAGIKAKIMVIEANIGGDKKSVSETVSRLSFSLDVVLPTDPTQFTRVGKVREPEKT